MRGGIISYLVLVHDRSGKIAIWPYIMRELPLSPVEALRLELRLKGSKGRQRPGTATTTTVEGSVVYYPANLASDDHTNGTNSNSRVPENEREGGSQTGSDLEAPKSTLHLDLNTRAVRSELRSPSAWGTQGRERENDVSPDRLAPGIMSLGRKSRRLRCDRRPASASSGTHRRPRHLLPSSQISLLHSATDDYAECPSGCGEEIRVQDIQKHQKSFCALR